ncbi:aminoglycoside 6-adenylyltransferase [Gracilibacillus sp. S3-1-1]|uniref:Aminoglycoside 6-adenylyltransferase n=1 Tax=Gracilibacillus pellucidus TaxID=3095368 RepID=A0ACC6M5S1_9BACI|nr:aminoglycoside 6-adenylyltransferase [Gracilibacillus sp. S3-1-1]MDX8046265.1 aminoglycoside 6-adenylyltransferase [Gracilibacillus sp. S3-1-1]
MGLPNKHYERDIQLPEYRKVMLKEIEKDLLNDKNVLAVFYGGSIANQNTDLYSDIDLRIIVKDGVFEEYRLNKKERAKRWGEVLYFEDFPSTTYSVAHYDTFIKVDTFYYKTKDIQPSVWLQSISIIYDKTGFMKEVLEKSKKLYYSPNVQEVDLWRTKFFAYVHEVYRRVNREELYYALSCLDNVRMSMVTAWYMDKGLQPNTFGDWAKYEGKSSKLESWQLSLLADWQSNREPSEIMEVIKKLSLNLKKYIKVYVKK